MAGRRAAPSRGARSGRRARARSARAARELGYTQSAVSQQIAQLERIVGQRLFDRPGGPRRVEPTEAGLLLLRHADAIVAQLDAARADMAALAEGDAGTLRVGIYQSVGARLLPALVRRFRAQWPRVGVRVREESDGGGPPAPARARRARPRRSPTCRCRTGRSSGRRCYRIRTSCSCRRGRSSRSSTRRRRCGRSRSCH